MYRYQPWKLVRIMGLTTVVMAMLALTGCETTPERDFQPLNVGGTNAVSNAAEPTLLREGDVLSVTFPGAPNLNSRVKITDGKISLPLIGEVIPVGKTVSELEKELLVKYDKQLVRKEVKVTLESTTFSVVVSGPGVLHPGPLTFERPTTLLQAVMQAKGDPPYILQGLSEALRFAQAAELDLDSVFDAISGGAAQSWQMENRWKSMSDDRFDFGFAVDWMRKDLGLALEEARANGATLPVTALVDQFYADVQALGGQRQDTSALVRRITRT